MLACTSDAAAWASLLKPLDVGVVVARLRSQHLERDVPPRASLLGQIDLGHGAPAQPAQQAIAAQLPARQFAGHRHHVGRFGNAHRRGPSPG